MMALFQMLSTTPPLLSPCWIGYIVACHGSTRICLIRRIFPALASHRRVLRAVTLSLYAIYLSACSPISQDEFSSARANDLLNSLVDIRSGDPREDDVERCPTEEIDIDSVDEYIARHLVDELGFSCTERQVGTTVRDSTTLWMLRHHDLLSWRGSTDGDAVVITLSYDRETESRSQLRSTLAPLASALEGLRALHRSGALGTRLVLVSVAQASPVTGDGIPGASALLGREIRYTTVTSSITATSPTPSPLLTGGGSGWMIASTSASGLVASSRTDANQLDQGQSRSTTGEQASPPPRLWTIPGGLAIHSVYRVPRNDGNLPALPELGQSFIRELRDVLQPAPQTAAVPDAWQRICTYTCEDDRVYWAIGILLPLLILYTAAKVLVVEADTVVEELTERVRRDKKARRRLTRAIKLLRQSKDKLEKRQHESPHSRPDQGGPSPLRPSQPRNLTKPSGFARLKWRLEKYQYVRLTARLGRTNKHLSSTRGRWKTVHHQLRPGQKFLQHWIDHRERVGDRLRKLGMDMWSHVSDTGAQRDTRIAVFCGATTCIVAFLLTLELESSGVSELWKVLALALAVFVIGTTYTRKKVWAFAVGAATICFVGLDTIELSPLANPTAAYQLANVRFADSWLDVCLCGPVTWCTGERC